MLKGKLWKCKEQADGLYAWEGFQWNSRKTEIETLEITNPVFRTDFAKLSANAGSERLKLQKNPEEKENTSFQTKTVAQRRDTIQSLDTNVDSLSSEVGILQKSQNDVNLLRVGAKVRKALLAN